MRRLFTLLLLVTFSQLSAQTYTSSCAHDTLLEKIYRSDAYKLALYRLYETNSPYRDSIDIPQKVIDSIANALYAVYNMPGSAMKDTLMNIFGFSDFKNNIDYEVDSSHIKSVGYRSPYQSSYFLRSFSIVVADTAGIADSWKAGNYNTTPDDSINMLVTKYGLAISKDHFQIYPNAVKYNVILPRLLNLQVLIDILAKKQGIVYCARQNYVGDGNYIKADFNSDTITLTYRNGCGDCPAGCTEEEKWVFKVYNCTVQVAKVQYPTTWGIQCPLLRGALPVTLSALSANLVKSDVVLQWTALTELNMLGYAVERSADGRRFKEIASLAAHNSPSGIAYNYSWIDAAVQANKVYYRVKAIDKSGEVTYTNTVIVSKDNTVGRIQVYPNPVTGNKVNVQFNNATPGKYSCSFFAVNGQQLYSTQITIAGAVTGQQITLPFKATGAIMLVIKNSKGEKVLSTLLAVK